MDFSTKVAVITGACSGIGEATAILFAEYGAQLVLVGRNTENLHKVATECPRPRGKVPLTITADVTKENEVKYIEQQTIHHFGRVDILVNSAGGIFLESILKPNLENFDKNFNLNLRSVYIMTAAFVPHLIKSKGNIINISCVVSDLILTGHIGYNVAKAGVEQLTKVTALELASRGVRANFVKPGFTKTDIMINMGMDKDDVEKNWKSLEQLMPLGKVIEAKEIARVIAFLSSDVANNVTGTSIVIDAGQTLSGLSEMKKVALK